MKQIVFISGKGGTGKSSIVASLTRIVTNKMIADCDVDAPNLHLLVSGEQIEHKDYFGAQRAFIDPSVCVSCGLCAKACRFDAISSEFEVSDLLCEGCGVCKLVCPENAVTLSQVKTGQTYLEHTPYGTFSHAILNIGAEGSGKLVTQVKENLYGAYDGEDWALIDGSPGIGCSVIASITGADAAVIVCEPTQSGQSDLKRVAAVARHFGTLPFVYINKYDLNEDITSRIEEDCRQSDIPVLGKLPYEPAVMKALMSLQTPIEAGLNDITQEINNMWNKLTLQLGYPNKGGKKL